jgi:hypothetical protein
MFYNKSTNSPKHAQHVQYKNSLDNVQLLAVLTAQFAMSAGCSRIFYCGYETKCQLPKSRIYAYLTLSKSKMQEK